MTAVLENAKSISIRKFGTLNTATEETKLPLGDSPNMSNVWTDEAPGSVQTAKGYLLAGTAPSGNPIKFLFNFRKDDGTQLALISDNATVWTTRDFKTFTSIITGLSSSFQLRAATARGKVWLTNGNDSVRTYNGTTVVVLDGSGGTPNVPKGKYVAYYHERVWVYNISGKRSSTRFAALTDSSGTEIAPDDATAWTATNEIKIGDGDGDFGTGMFVYDQKLHFFKPKSIWRMEGIDEFSYFPFKTRAEIGPRIAENVALLDGLLQFVSLGGYYEFNGDTTERVSDILNPTSGLGNLSVSDIQSPDTNQQFWLQDVAADFDAGTVSDNIDTSVDSLILKPMDDSSTDFAAGIEQTNIDASLIAGSILLARSSSGVSAENVASGRDVTAQITSGSLVGNASSVTDGSTTSSVGFSGTNPIGSFYVALDSSLHISRIILRGYSSSGQKIISTIAFTSLSNLGVPIIPTAVDHGGSIVLGSVRLPAISSATDITIDITATSMSFLGIGFSPTGGPGNVSITEIEAYPTPFMPTGKFVAKTLDLGATPSSLGKFQADYDLNDGSLIFFTQTSADGVSWDAEVSVTSGSAIASVARRYIRWGVYFTSNSGQTASPVIRKVYGPGVFISQKFDTASTIFQWKAYQADQDPAEGTILHFYRTATSLVNLDSATWTAIVPGSDIVSATTDTFVQFKVELSSGTSAREPSVDSVIINWIVGTAGAIRSEQLVHGIAWNGRYWTDVSELGESANNLMLIRGRKTFSSPWQLKRDWNMLALFIFNDALYAGSSTNSNIYRLDFGYSSNGSALDSYFETGDTTGDDPDFQKQLNQMIVDYELMGDNADYELSVGVSTDRGDTYTEKEINLLGTGRRTKALNVSERERQFRFRFRTNGIDQPYIVHGIDGLYRATKFR